MSGAALVKGLGASSGMTRQVSDGSLALRAADGDERAFAAIFDRHHQGLYRYCLTLVGNPQDAQDALQNTMIKVLRGLPGEERQIALKPWLYRIAHNESIQLLRRRRETRPLDPNLRAAQAGLAEAAAARERLRILISDLDRLPERQRGALIMRELAGLDFAEIGAALGTSAAVVRQTLYEARLSLQQMDEGREMSCESVTRALSDGDGRVARRRDLRAHLRTCVGCRGFSQDIESRERQFASLAPLPTAAAAGLLQGLLTGHGAAGGGFAGTLGGGAAKSLGASAAFKGAATVAVVAALGAGAADRGGLIDLGLASADDSRAGRVERAAVTGLPGARPARSGPIADDAKAGPAAGVKAPGNLDLARTAKHAEPRAPRSPSTPGADAVAAETAKVTETATPGDGHLAASGGASSNAGPPPSPVSASQDNPAGHPSGKGHEKQLPSASGHGQETASSHKAEAQGSEPPPHPEHPAHPAHPAQASNPAAGEEPPASPVAPEANGNAKGKGTPPAAGAEETPSGHETGKKP